MLPWPRYFDLLYRFFFSYARPPYKMLPIEPPSVPRVRQSPSIELETIEIVEVTEAGLDIMEEVRPIESAWNTISQRDFIMRIRPGDMASFNACVEDLEQPMMLVHEFHSKSSFSKYSFSEGAVIMLQEPNAGGNSVESEVLSYEVLRHSFGAEFHKTEMELMYSSSRSQKTDYSVMIGNHRLGVSVTRIMHFIDPKLLTVDAAKSVLTKKLKGVMSSSKYIVEEDRWERQILHVWVQSHCAADKVRQAYASIFPVLHSNTIVLVTVAANADFIFLNRRGQYKEALSNLKSA